MGTFLKTSGQSRRIISIRYPRSSTTRFNGRMTVPGITESLRVAGMIAHATRIEATSSSPSTKG